MSTDKATSDVSKDISAIFKSPKVSRVNMFTY